jgi:Ni,Fe-hydrogenase III small subunit/Fe-S-cluster-containing hydrogenase component 2
MIWEEALVNKGCMRILRSTFKKKATLKRTELETQPDSGNSTPIYKPAYATSDCRGCSACMDICPTNAISRNNSGQLIIKYDSCIECRACIDICACGALTAGPGVIGESFRYDLRHDYDVEYIANKKGANTKKSGSAVSDGKRSSAPIQTGPGDKSSIDAEEKAKSGKIKLFVRSMHIREVDCGSCNACELEIAAITNPVYDAERFGIHIVASPRHADVLFVTGPVTEQMELAFRKTDSATPEPKLIVAIGTCACSGGLFGSSSEAGAGVDGFARVDYYIPGCPPSPRTIIKSIAALRSISYKQKTRY